MNVKELRDMLAKLPDEAEVVMPDGLSVEFVGGTDMFVVISDIPKDEYEEVSHD